MLAASLQQRPVVGSGCRVQPTGGSQQRSQTVAPTPCPLSATPLPTTTYRIHSKHRASPASGALSTETASEQAHYVPPPSSTSTSHHSNSNSSSSIGASSDARDMSASLSLTNIRNALIRQEDTIIFNFIERAQFARNEVVYQSDAIPVPGFDASGRRYSLLEYLLRATEQLHGSVRRYTSPDEHAFYPEDQPLLVLPPLSYPSVLAPCARSVNLNAKIMEVYLNEILPGITTPGDDNNHGSASTLDVLVLQALSKRIHYGKFVAEAKFRADPEGYTCLIQARDSDAIMALLTDVAVEKKVIERVRLKAATFGQDITPDAAAPSTSARSTSSPDHAADGAAAPAGVHAGLSSGVSSPGGRSGSDGTSAVPAAATYPAADLGSGVDEARRYKVSPDVVAAVYERVVMPLTKEVEVEYLLRRLD